MPERNVKQNETTLFSQKQYTPFTEGGVSPKRSTRGVFERFPPFCFRAKKKHSDDDDDDECAPARKAPSKFEASLCASKTSLSKKTQQRRKKQFPPKRQKKKHTQRYLAEEQRTHVDTL